MKHARRKRFKVKSDVKVSITIRTLDGEVVKGDVCDLSQTGVLFEIAKGTQDIPFKDGQILPEGKITWDTHEWAFGRGVLKFLRDGGERLSIGMMFIDNLAPLDGKLSKVLESSFDPNMRERDLNISEGDVSLGDFLAVDIGSNDIFAKAKRYQNYVISMEKSERFGYWITRKPSKGARVQLAKSRPDGRNDFLVFASNDYLGLASHPEVIDAAKTALDRYGFGSTGSSVTTGQTEEHEALEELLSRTLRTESALLFNSGYAANTGIIAGLVGPSDLVIADILSHASIMDGMQMSQGVKRFFKHGDAHHLKRVLERSRAEASGCLIVVEGVFSMDGDSAPLEEILDIARKYDARIMIDEAHSFGVLGKHGLGLAEEAGLMGGIDLTMGTFSKICGAIGGFAAGSREIVDWLKVSARSTFFSVSIPPSTAAAARKGLELFLSRPELLTRLRENINHFAHGLREMGFNLPLNHRTPILPAIVGDEVKLGKIYKMLIDEGVYTIPVVFPAVSRNTCRFRFTVTANHSLSDLDYALIVLKRALEKVGFDASSSHRNREAA
jgi:8-amino-7-oxononanoate synthase